MWSQRHKRGSQPGGYAAEDNAGQMAEWMSALNRLMAEKASVIIAIDGPSGAGKSSLAGLLQTKYGDCAVFHMDDFFLPADKKTPERLQTPGGNVDWERFLREVLLPLMHGEPFAYRPFNCGTGELAEPVRIAPRKLNLVEGVYSHHPALREAYDAAVFLSVGRREQLDRILARNGETMLQRFVEEWIPLEDLYFEKMEIREKADYIISV